MKLEFIQVEKTSLMARFEIKHGTRTVGAAEFASFLESGQGNWTASFGGHAVEIRYAKPRAVAVGIDSNRPYEVFVDEHLCGIIEREADVVAAGAKILAITAQLYGATLHEYPFARGRKGFRYPVFEDDRQIAEISKGCKVRDDLHSFELAIEDEQDAFSAFVLCCYTFSQSWWYPGPPRKSHTHMYVQRATKPGHPGYDDSFFDRVSA